MVKLNAVDPRPGCKLYLEYDDGVAGEIDLSHLVGKGVFQLWDEPEHFDAVSVGPHGEIRWTDDVEICADAAYLELTGRTAEDLFPKLKVPADA